MKEKTEPTIHAIEYFQLQNQNGMTVRVTNYGAIITSILVPDRNGEIADVALGFETAESYAGAVEQVYLGAVVGRFCNRIAEGRFRLDGKQYSLIQNNNGNHLHGGGVGFDKVFWTANHRPAENSVALSYQSSDNEEGYPGNLDVTVTYTLTADNAIVIDYAATTDQPTPINVTQHTYFNLKGEGSDTILDHELSINAKRFLPTDAGSIPLGDPADVHGTPFDFTTAKPIGRDINADHEQLELAGGYDHNWILNRGDDDTDLVAAAEAYEPKSGRRLNVETTQPGMQFYTGNFLDGRLVGKSGNPYPRRSGFCLETQHFPDSPNQPDYPSTILRPGETFTSQTIYRFSTQ